MMRWVDFLRCRKNCEMVVWSCSLERKWLTEAMVE